MIPYNYQQTMCDKTMVKVQYAVRFVGNAGSMSVIVIWIHIKILKGNQKAKIEEYTMQYPTENDKKDLQNITQKTKDITTRTHSKLG
jgi:hypothetical protein